MDQLVGEISTEAGRGKDKKAKSESRGVKKRRTRRSQPQRSKKEKLAGERGFEGENITKFLHYF